MIIPIRCFTCNKVIADKWEYYVAECKKIDDNEKNEIEDDINKFFEKNLKKDLLNKLGLNKQCCRRHFLGHVDLIETI